MDLVALHAASKPDAIALVEGERSLTWAALDSAKNRCARALLSLGLEPGQRVVAYHANSIDGFVAALGAQRAGLTVVPLNHRLTAPEAAYILADSDAAAVFHGEEFDTVVSALQETGPKVPHWFRFGGERGRSAGFAELLSASEAARFDDDADLGGTMIYTSGTTGKPKGAVRGAMQPADQIGYLQVLVSELSLRPGDVHLAAGPLYHSAPRAFAGVAAALGNTIVLLRKFDPRAALDAIERHRVGDTFMAPILIKRLLALPGAEFRSRDLSAFHTLIVAGAPCPLPIKQGVAERLGEVLYEFYGSTELGVNTLLKPRDQLRKPGSCGLPFPGVTIEILGGDGEPVPVGTPGEVHIARNTQVFSGYHKRVTDSRASPAGELISVGDVAYRDEEGFLYICDRKSDMVISGGVNIYPAEIEQCLVEHPEIADAAVFGIPSDEWGEAVHAVLELEPGVVLGAADVEAWLEPRLADFKRPRSIDFVARLPRDNAGKLLKRMLREPFWAGHERRIQ